jgi:transketolase C-terminal domain/subunit
MTSKHQIVRTRKIYRTVKTQDGLGATRELDREEQVTIELTCDFEKLFSSFAYKILNCGRDAATIASGAVTAKVVGKKIM